MGYFAVLSKGPITSRHNTCQIRSNAWSWGHATGCCVHCHPPPPGPNGTMESRASVPKIRQGPYFPKGTFIQMPVIICLLTEAKEGEGRKGMIQEQRKINTEELYAPNYSGWEKALNGVPSGIGFSSLRVMGLSGQTPVFFPTSSWQGWMIPLEEQPWLHVFYEALPFSKMSGL